MRRLVTLNNLSGFLYKNVCILGYEHMFDLTQFYAGANILTFAAAITTFSYICEQIQFDSKVHVLRFIPENCFIYNIY